MTTEQTQHARDSAELRRLCSERDHLREKVAEQAREIAVLKANVITDNSMVLVNALAELERLKVQPSGVVLPEPEIASEINRLIGLWDAKVAWSGQCMEELLDHAARAATLIARLNSSPVSAGDERGHVIKELDAEACGDIDYAQVSGALGAYELFGQSLNSSPVSAGVVDERAAFEAWRLEKFCGGTERLKKCSNAPDVYYYTAEQEAWKAWQARAALSAPSHGELVREIERLNYRYQREVYGLNNEGDPIGGDPAGGYANDNARLRKELAALKAKPGGMVRWPEADEIMQMAFEEGQPSEDASGYYFELEEFDLFIQRLMEEVARLNSSPVSAGHDEQVREGWQLVPVEPTDAMLEAGDKYIGTPATYKSMLSACPSPAITKDFSQFLSAVMDAAGLIRHGRQSKELSEYLGMKCMEYRGAALSAPSHGEQVRVPDVDLAMHLLSDRWPESSERIEVEVFAEWLRDLLAASPAAGSQEQGE